MNRDLDGVLNTMRQHLVSGHRITGINKLAAGHSNETYLLEGLDLILRLMPTGEPLTQGYGIVDQFQIYAAVGGYADAPPVPSVRYLCTDNAVLGEPFYLMERVTGISFDEYTDKDWFISASDEFRDSIFRQFCAAVAGLAKIPPLEVLGPLRVPAADCALYRTTAAKTESTKLVQLLDELEAQAPALTSEPSVVHGDTKFANTIWENGKLKTLLDWELSYNGDPRADLGYTLHCTTSPHAAKGTFGTASGIWSRERIIEEWEQVSGREAKDIRWFEASSAAKLATFIIYGAHLYKTGQTQDKKMAAWDSDAVRDMMIESLQTMMDAI